MTRDRQLRLIALAAIFRVPGVQVSAQDTDRGCRLVIAPCMGSTEDRYLEGSQKLHAVGLRPLDSLYVDREEWDAYLLEALRAVAKQEEAEQTADHGEPAFNPRVGAMPGLLYDVHAPDQPVVTCLAGDLVRTIGETQKTGKPARVSARLPRAMPSTVDEEVRP